MDIQKIKLGKVSVVVYDVTKLDMTSREDLGFAWGEALSKGLGPQRRVWAAAIGLGTKVGRESKLVYSGDVVAYGGAIYRHLVDDLGATIPEIREAGVNILSQVVTGLFPREEEVEERRVFSEGREDT